MQSINKLYNNLNKNHFKNIQLTAIFAGYILDWWDLFTGSNLYKNWYSAENQGDNKFLNPLLFFHVFNCLQVFDLIFSKSLINKSLFWNSILDELSTFSMKNLEE